MQGSPKMKGMSLFILQFVCPHWRLKWQKAKLFQYVISHRARQAFSNWMNQTPNFTKIANEFEPQFCFCFLISDSCIQFTNMAIISEHVLILVFGHKTAGCNNDANDKTPWRGKRACSCCQLNKPHLCASETYSVLLTKQQAGAHADIS